MNFFHPFWHFNWEIHCEFIHFLLVCKANSIVDISRNRFSDIFRLLGLTLIYFREKYKHYNSVTHLECALVFSTTHVVQSLSLLLSKLMLELTQSHLRKIINGLAYLIFKKNKQKIHLLHIGASMNIHSIQAMSNGPTDARQISYCVPLHKLSHLFFARIKDTIGLCLFRWQPCH